MNPVIKLEGIRCYAYHGCLEEEARVGGEYIVDVMIEADVITSCLNDRLEDTVDYVEVFGIVKKQMAERSSLIENAAMRILRALRDRFRVANEIQVTVTKLNPPVNGDLPRTSVTISTKALEALQ